MVKFKVFISSVQSEFAIERQRLYDFVRTDELISQYFEPFIFEKVTAQDTNPRQLYLEEAQQSDLYLLLVGQWYGNALPGDLSPTEKEYEAAAKGSAYRVAFIRDLDENVLRDEPEERFFRRVQNELTYRIFSNPSVLISLVKQSLIEYLKYKGIIQSQTFDEQVHPESSIADIDEKKVREFVRAAREKRAFPLQETDSVEKVLRHLRMLRGGRPTNAALLAFAKDPQYYFPTAILKCAWFLGTETVKPIEDYKTFEGDVMEQINQATSWVMSKMSLRFGRRDAFPQNETEFEIPRSVIHETIVNAVAHRDYNSRGSVQVSVFRNRIVVRNPGRLPIELTKADLCVEHGSYPHNPQLAEALFQAGYIEKYGTGITENIRLMREAHLLDPEIDLSAEFVTTVWRPNLASSEANVDSNLASLTSNLASFEANVASNLASSTSNLASSGLNVDSAVVAAIGIEAQQRLVAQVVIPHIKPRMTKAQISDCIMRLCIVEHTTEELSRTLGKEKRYLRNEIIPDMVRDGKLLPTRRKTDPNQAYMTNPKYKSEE